MEKCCYCRTKLNPQTTTRVQQYEDKWVILENVPALVCDQCGETFYTPDAHDLVIRLLNREAAPVRTETIQVYDANSL
jgi:HTH-type transcriptional regulator / antitoxin MqsA